MLATIAKEFTFEAAHLLPNHDGQCRRLHGHSYRARVFARGHVRPNDGTPEEGMVLDFARLGEVFRRRIHARCDHQFLNETLPLACTTAEQIAGWILSELRAEVPEVVAVRLYETPTAYAEVTVADLAQPGEED